MGRVSNKGLEQRCGIVEGTGKVELDWAVWVGASHWYTRLKEETGHARETDARFGQQEVHQIAESQRHQQVEP